MPVKVGILAQPLVASMIGVPSVMLANIGAAFPHVSRTGLQLIIVLNVISMFVSSLFTGMIAGKLKKKDISVIALLLLLVSGGIVIIFHDNIIYFYASSIFGGLGTGMLLANVTILSSMYFEGAERSKMFGYQGASQNIGSMTIKLVVGILGTGALVKAYYTYFLALVPLLIVLIALPADTVPEKRGEAANSGKTRLPKGAVLICIIAMLGIACAFGITYNLALYISNEGIGALMLNAAAQAILVAAAAVAGFSYQFIQKKSKAYCLSIAFAISSAGYILLALFPNAAVVLTASAIAGFGYGLITPSCIQAITDISSNEQMPRATASVIAFGGFGAVLTPFILNPLGTQTPMLASAGASEFLKCAIGFVLLCVAAAVWYPRYTRTGQHKSDEAI